MVPECRPGYIDVTAGVAYEWACAHYCVGGHNFAQANCQCACLTQDQIDRLGLIVGQVPTLPPQATQGPGQVLVTARPTSTTAPRDPAIEFDVGDLGDGEGFKPPAPVGDGNYIADDPDAPPADEITDPAAGAVDTTLIVVIASSSFCCLALIMLGCAFWTGVLMRKPTRVSDLHYVETPAISLHAPNGDCPLPGAMGQEISSRASSRTSCGSRGPQERSASRRSSNVSQTVYTNQVAGAGGPFYNPQDLEVQGRSNSRRSSNASVGGPFYNPQDLQAQGRSSSRRSSASQVPAGGPFYTPQDIAASPGSRRNSEAGQEGSTWAHKVPGDDRDLAPSSSKLSVQSGRRMSNTSGDASPGGGGSGGESPERRNVSNQPRSTTHGTHLSTADARSLPSNRRPSKQSNLSVDVPGTVPGSRRGSKSSNASRS